MNHSDHLLRLYPDTWSDDLTQITPGVESIMVAVMLNNSPVQRIRYCTSFGPQIRLAECKSPKIYISVNFSVKCVGD